MSGPDTTGEGGTLSPTSGTSSRGVEFISYNEGYQMSTGNNRRRGKVSAPAGGEETPISTRPLTRTAIAMNTAKERVREEEVDWRTVTTTELKQYGRLLVKEYRELKAYAAAEELECSAVEEELRLLPQAPFSSSISAGSPMNGPLLSERSPRRRRRRLEARLEWLRRRRLQRTQLRARVQQLMAALQQHRSRHPSAPLSLLDASVDGS